ncbi:MAG: sulfotransferase family 2 domain-containing protein [Roseibium sp.]|uniref:sulfotransferase family 2 domain-containing protein n=1 Tax=Roseibium sp. TaxID=1936156 RepID=UPI003D9C6291
MKKKPPIFFVHIPKTGGTSFRKAAEKYYSSKKTIYDYEANSVETSKIVKKLIYQKNSIFDFKKHISNTDVRFFGGHVNSSKFLPVFGLRHTVTFVRDPSEQLISHFRHFKREYGFTGTFESFATNSVFNSMQSRMLRCVPLEAYGLVGITERYDASIELFNSTYSTSVNSTRMNVAEQQENEDTIVTTEMTELAKKCTVEDQIVYDRALQLLNSRIAIRNKSLPFVHGTILNNDENLLSGFAFYEGSEAPVSVILRVNGTVITDAKEAQDFRPILAAFNSPRAGFVGFQFRTPHLVSGDLLECVVAKTGQVLWEKSG